MSVALRRPAPTASDLTAAAERLARHLVAASAEVRERCRTLQGYPICGRPGCGRPFRPRDVSSAGGSAQRYCSSRCRVADYKATHRRVTAPPAEVVAPPPTELPPGPPDLRPAPGVPLSIRRRRLEFRIRELGLRLSA